MNNNDGFSTLGGPNKRSGRRRVGAVVAAVAAASLALAACGSSSNSTSNTTAGSASSTTAKGGSSDTGAVSSAAAALAALNRTAVPQPRPSAPVTPGSHKVAVISVGQATPGASTTAVFVQEAIKAIGWTAPPTFDGKFSPTTQSGLIETAVNDGYQGLVLISVTPSTVASALDLALSKHVAVTCILCGPPSTFSQFKGVVGIEPSPQKIGAAQADYVIAKSGGKAKVWVYEDNEFNETVAQTAAALSTLKSECSGCSTHVAQTKAGDEDAPGIPVLSGVLDAHPKGSISWIIAPYDNAAANFAKLAAQDGRTEIGFVGYAALPIFYDQIQAGTPPGAQATVSIPLPYMGWASIDELARILADEPSWDANSLNVSMADRANYKAYGSQPWVAPTFDFKSYFLKLWDKS